MQQSLYISKLRHRRQRIPKRAAGKHIDMSYSKYKLNSTIQDNPNKAKIVSVKQNRVEQLEKRLQIAQQYVEMLEHQALNYRVYVKNLQLTEEQYIRTNRLANQIRENQRKIKRVAEQFRQSLDKDNHMSETSAGKENVSQVCTICCNRHRNW